MFAHLVPTRNLLLAEVAGHGVKWAGLVVLLKLIVGIPLGAIHTGRRSLEAVLGMLLLLMSGKLLGTLCWAGYDSVGTDQSDMLLWGGENTEGKRIKDYPSV